MYFFLVVILILLTVDFVVFTETKKYINEKYKKTLNLLNRFNPLYKFEMKRSEDSFFMRMLVLSLFWLSINLILIVIDEGKNMDLDPSFLYVINFMNDKKYFIIPIIGLFIYFGIHVYSRNNSYIRVVDMLMGIIPTLFVTFMS
tara:strand:- start:972 stop:1403 length:432 start_codon:yes stop_codon:yes gene_type:complete